MQRIKLSTGAKAKIACPACSSHNARPPIYAVARADEALAVLSAVCDSCGGMIEVEIERADGDTLAVGHALRGMGIGVDMTAVTAVPDKNPAQLIAERFVPEA